MDPSSSGEDPATKTRKPYTITKQRERWTEDEHNRFLEAIKLYGRAWQRIEEHLGTKTAVQIRSHAQKFFTKLEKEAIVKGVPIGQSLDIEIPPPRPKRKPHNPYPRKTTVGTPASSSCREKESEKPCDQVKFRNSNEYHDKDNHPEVSCESPSSAYKIASVSDAPKISCSFRQYVPHSREPMHQDEIATSQVTTEAKGYPMEKSDTKQPFHENLVLKISDVVDPYPLQEKSVHSKNINELQQSENSGMADVHSSQNYPCHVPLQILDGSSGMTALNISQDMAYADSIFRQMGGVCAHQNLSMNPESSVHHSFPTYHPSFSPILSRDDCQSLLHVSTAFSSLTVSALLQNPAASFAAIMRPSLTMEPSTASAGGFESRPLSTNPSMAAIAAATVAAATAWWEAHGLLPFSAPSHPAFPCSPPSPSATPMACRQDRAANRVRRETSHDPAMNLKAALPNPEMAKVEVTTAELQSTNKKLVERSSCGSNTSSSSEVEGDALEKHIEEKDMKEKEEQEEVDPMHLLGDPFGRRCRSTSNGRIAFDALFSREILPQSFLPHKGKAWSTCSSLICGSIEDGPLNMGLGVGESKVKANRTGFKPYKRCSVEAKDEEKCPKRLRLQGDPST